MIELSKNARRRLGILNQIKQNLLFFGGKIRKEVGDVRRMGFSNNFAEIGIGTPPNQPSNGIKEHLQFLVHR